MFTFRNTRAAVVFAGNYTKIIGLQAVNVITSRDLSKVSVDNGIAVYEFDRPPVNSMNLDAFKDIVNVLNKAEENKWKALIFTSALPKIFSAGIDFKELYKADPKRLATVWHTLQEVAIKIMTSNFITATAINGYTSAGGCLLSMLSDFRVAVEGKYTIGFNDTAVGIVPPVWVTKLMLHTLSPRKGELTIIASTLFSPKAAVEIGLVDELALDKTDAIERCKKFIKNLDHIAPKVISATRQQAKEAPLSWLIENRQKDCDNFVKKNTSPETQQILEQYLKMLKNKKKSTG